MKKNIYTVVCNNKLSFCLGGHIKKIIKDNPYCLVTNRGSAIYPMITYHTNEDKKEYFIGNTENLMDFLIDRDNDELLIMRGFKKSQSASILKCVNIIKKKNCDYYLVPKRTLRK